uniref:Sushi, von Willebrand factor type A, EGF and pentraxin domain-containing protein 1-like n=1 Tax=Phallusia mammillata TaxID=59560 RepID=A0A6F9DTH5_9ASCI|nr:sushi, von Willebrand factor type A, EGF and pentraxin domain-containing protein 1-like [Phallusia mammillata]
MFGPAQQVCERGNWNPVASPACVQLACPPLRPVTDGGFAPIDFQYSTGEVVNYFCDGGFSLFGSSTSINCIDTGPPSVMGVWDPPEPAGCTLISPTNTACLSFPCLNGGTCLHKPAPPFFECVCTSAATGPTCSIPP